MYGYVGLKGFSYTFTYRKKFFYIKDIENGYKVFRPYIEIFYRG